LVLAEEHGIRSIAFPAISTGVYRFPKDRAERIARETISRFLDEHDTIEKVILVFFK